MYGIRFLSCGDFYSSVGWDTGERNVDSHILIHFPNASQTSYFERDSQWQLEKPCYVLSASRTLHRFIFDPSQSVRHQFFHFQGQPPSKSNAKKTNTYISSIQRFRYSPAATNFADRLSAGIWLESTLQWAAAIRVNGTGGRFIRRGREGAKHSTSVKSCTASDGNNAGAYLFHWRIGCAGRLVP